MQYRLFSPSSQKATRDPVEVITKVVLHPTMKKLEEIQAALTRWVALHIITDVPQIRLCLMLRFLVKVFNSSHTNKSVPWYYPWILPIQTVAVTHFMTFELLNWWTIHSRNPQYSFSVKQVTIRLTLILSIYCAIELLRGGCDAL